MWINTNSTRGIYIPLNLVSVHSQHDKIIMMIYDVVLNVILKKTDDIMSLYLQALSKQNTLFSGKRSKFSCLLKKMILINFYFILIKKNEMVKR